MPTNAELLSLVEATVEEILPQLGLAYLADDKDRSWGVTRATPGAGIDSLRVGGRVKIQLRQVESFTVVQSYSMLG